MALMIILEFNLNDGDVVYESEVSIAN